MTDIARRLTQVRTRITEAEQRFHRPAGSVTLVAVSKTRPATDIVAALAAGQTHFGESYVSEALTKIHALMDTGITWHYIGAIQSNKTADIAAHFDWVHSIASLKIAERLDRQRPDHLPPLNVCIQVNVSAEPQKAGVHPQDLPALAQAIQKLPRLKLHGLMAIPRFNHDFDSQRLPFHALHQALEQLNAAGLALDTLSMGMSADMEAAIAEGATMVRIGTDIFGSRPTKTTTITT